MKWKIRSKKWFKRNGHGAYSKSIHGSTIDDFEKDVIITGAYITKSMCKPVYEVGDWVEIKDNQGFKGKIVGGEGELLRVNWNNCDPTLEKRKHIQPSPQAQKTCKCKTRHPGKDVCPICGGAMKQ